MTRAATKLGIWMDYEMAHIMEFNANVIETKTIESKFTLSDKENIMHNSNHEMHNHEQHNQEGYFKQLAEIILNYEEVILFGSTSAKDELLSKITTDKRFENIQVCTQQTNKMTEKQQHVFVQNYFSNL